MSEDSKCFKLVIKIDAPLWKFSADTNRQLFCMISADTDVDIDSFFRPTNAVNYTGNPLIWYIRG